MWYIPRNSGLKPRGAIQKGFLFRVAPQAVRADRQRRQVFRTVKDKNGKKTMKNCCILSAKSTVGPPFQTILTCCYEIQTGEKSLHDPSKSLKILQKLFKIP